MNKMRGLLLVLLALFGGVPLFQSQQTEIPATGGGNDKCMSPGAPFSTAWRASCDAIWQVLYRTR
jgi:hypothetical protein